MSYIRITQSVMAGLVLTTLAVNAVFADEPRSPAEADVVVAEVLGQPVTKADLKDRTPASVLLTPIMTRYKEEHQSELTPTDEQLQFTFDHINAIREARLEERGLTVEEVQSQIAELKRVSDTQTLPKERQRMFDTQRATLENSIPEENPFSATFLLNGWMLQRHFYLNYGGGRVLWQQAGVEAFDAMHQFLKTEIEAGRLKFFDDGVREETLHYWTSQEGSAFLSADSARIHEWMTEPDWAHPSLHVEFQELAP